MGDPSTPLGTVGVHPAVSPNQIPAQGQEMEWATHIMASTDATPTYRRREKVEW